MADTITNIIFTENYTQTQAFLLFFYVQQLLV